MRAAAVGPVGPEQARQGFAAVRAVRLHDQVGQESARLVRLETVDRFAVQFDAKAAQQTHDKLCHGDAPRTPDKGIIPHAAFVANG